MSADLDQYTVLNGDMALRVVAKIALKDGVNVELKVDENNNLVIAGPGTNGEILSQIAEKSGAKAYLQLDDNNNLKVVLSESQCISSKIAEKNGEKAYLQLDDVDNLLVSGIIRDGETEKAASVDSLGGLNVSEVERLAGTAFSGTTKDPNFWVEDNDGSGSISQAGEVTLATGTTADSRARYTSVRKGRKVTGVANQFRAVARNKQAPQENCVRRIGAFCANDGYFFQFNGLTFGVGVRKGGSDTIINNGSFNGNLGATVDLGGAIDFNKVVIEYTALSAKFFINDSLLHTIRATNESLTNTLDLKVQMEVYNENGNTTNNEYEVLFACIISKGKNKTATTAKFLEGDSSPVTTVLKYGAGRLARIIIPDNISGGVEIYDGIDVSGTKICELDTAQGSEPLGEISFDTSFNEGLTVVLTGSGTKATVIYE